MAAIEFLQIEVLLAIHVDQTTRYGGDASIGDLGLIESAIAQPQASFGENYLHAFPFEMAGGSPFQIDSVIIFTR